MTVIGEAFVRVRPQTDGFEQEASSSIGGAMRRVAGVVGGIVAVSAAVDFARGGIEALMELERLSAQTEAALQSTGAAAWTSTSQIEDYAGSLERMSGVEQESIQNGQNLLLTFTNVRNGVGENEQIFDRATAAALDMSVAMGTDMSSSAMMLGKALNDPTDGLSKLSRAGVQFSDQQKEQIITMQAAGDVAGAQALMLEELERQFGGSAAAFGETTAGQVARLKNSFGDLQEQLAAQLLPALVSVLGFMLNTGIPALQRFGEWVGPIIGEAISDLRDRFEEMRPSIEAFIQRAAEVAEQLLPRMQEVLGFVAENWEYFAAGLALVVAPLAAITAGLIYAYTESETFRNIVDGAISWIRDNVPPILEQVAAIFVSVFEIIVRVVEVGLDAVMAFWRTFGDAILTYVGGTFDAVMQIVQGALDVIQGIVNTVLAVITGDWSAAWDGIQQIIDGVWQVINGIIDAAMAGIQSLIEAGMTVVAGIFDAMWAAIVALWDATLGRILGLVTGWISSIGSLISTLGSTIIANVTGGLEAFVALIGSVGQRVIDYFTALPGNVIRGLGNIGAAIWGAIQGGMNALVGSVTGIVDSVGNQIGRIPGLISGIVFAAAAAATSVGTAITQGIVNGISGFASAAGDFARAFRDAVISVINREVIDRINRTLSFSIPVPFGPDIPINPPDIPHLHTGGIVPGSAGSEVPAMLLAGEGVFTQDQMAALGRLIAGAGGGGRAGAVTVNVFVDRMTASREDGERAAAMVGAGVAAVFAGHQVALNLRGSR